MTTKTTTKATNKKTTTKTVTKNTSTKKVTKTTQPVDKSVDKSVDNLKSNFSPKVLQETLKTTLLALAKDIHKEQPSNQGFDQNHLDLYVNAASHVNLHNMKKYIKCLATDDKELNVWAQHMSIILVDELRKAVTASYFKIKE